MSGQSAVSVRIPLPQAFAVYGSANTFHHYEHLDWLGSTRLSSYQNRTMYTDVAYAPFGEVYASSATDGISFTGMRSDITGMGGSVVDGLYDFPAREQASTQSRWISPDPAHAGWNLYAYVSNDPLLFTDSTGNYIDNGNPSCLGCGSYMKDPGSYGMALGGRTCQIDGAEIPCDSGLIGSGDSNQILPGNCRWSYCLTWRGIIPIHPTRNDNFGGCGGSGYSYFCIEFAPMPDDASTRQANIYWQIMKVFATGVWRNFKDELKEGGCFRQFLEESFDPREEIAQRDQAIKSSGQNAAWISGTVYAAERGLIVPMRSSIVRGILKLGEVGGEVTALGLTVYDEGNAIINEGMSYARGECR